MDNAVKILLVAGGAYLVYNYWSNAQAAAAAVPPGTAPAPAPGSGTVTPAPVSTAPAPAPPPASTAPAPAPAPAPPPVSAPVSLVGAVTPNINNSLTANVKVNGQTMNITIIQTSGRAYDTGGHDITATLTSAGVDVAALLQKMQAAYALAHPGWAAPGVSGLSLGRLGAWSFYRPGSMAGLGRNYVRRGSPMRRRVA